MSWQATQVVAVAAGAAKPLANPLATTDPPANGPKTVVPVAIRRVLLSLR